MKISTISFAYNESYLLPFYLKHYESIIDEFNVVYDTDSTDNTYKILKAHPKVNIIPFTFPSGMDDVLKVNKINELYKTLDCDVVLNVDIDEYVLSERQDIERMASFPVVNVRFADVYRHITEQDLDINKPIRSQRRHGFFHPMYNKPIIAHTGLNIAWLPGNHVISTGQHDCHGVDCGLIGAHWSNADTCFCVDRRVKNRRDRQSKYNIDNKLTVQHHNITEQDVINQCKEHEKDVALWL
jgi:hypothetical protein